MPRQAITRHTRDFHRAFSELLRLYQFRDRDRVCYQDISVAQCYALEAVIRHEGCNLKTLAGVLYVDKSTASRVADALERKGYIARTADPESRRSIILTATRAGRALHARIELQLLTDEQRLLSELDEEAQDAVTRLLAGLTEVASKRMHACTRSISARVPA